MPPPPFGGHYVFISSVRTCVCPCVRPPVMLFHQTFVSNAFLDKDELIRFWGSKCQRSRSVPSAGGGITEIDSVRRAMTV